VTERAIGIFDSGVGGLTVVKSMMELLPEERVVYLGDTARVPYGPKSPETVIRYSRQIASWLVEQGVKAIVVACNTATAHALPTLQREIAVPVLGVIAPGAQAAVAATRTGHIGVIGTAGTIASQAYDCAIHALVPTAHVTGLPCPLFVPLVEEGWIDHPATRLIAESYLEPLRTAQIDTLVLGCTHYPLLAGVIGATVGASVVLVDSATETARSLQRLLREQRLSSGGSPASLRHRFVATDAPDSFRRLARRVIGPVVDNVETAVFA
jgi:glutamate racemase